MKTYINYLFIFLLCISFSIAYDSNNLISYYTMGDGLTGTIYDSIQENEISTYRSASQISNLIYGNSLLWDYDTTAQSTGAFSLNNTVALNNDFTLNFWINQSDEDSINNYLGFNPASTSQNVLNTIRWLYSMNSTHIREIAFTYYSSGYKNIGSVTVNILKNSASMITLIHDDSDDKISVYVNGVFKGNISRDLASGLQYVIFGSHSTAYDEISLWNAKLTSSDLLNFYNNGSIMSYGNLTNTSSLEPNSSVVTFYDICIGNQLCHNFYYNIDNESLSYCPITVGGVLNIEVCIANCLDNQSYYELIGYTPADNNYTGVCSYCSSACTTLNATRCNGYYVEQCVQSYTGCNKWLTSLSCPYGCTNGFCNLIPTSMQNTTGLGSTDSTSIDLWCPFFNIECSDSSANRLMVAFIVNILSIILGIAIIFTLMNILKYIPVPLGLGIMLIFTFIPALYFIVIGFYPFWLLLIIIGLIALIGAGWYTGLVRGK